MQKPSILIVDDEKAARYGMRKILQKDNYTVYEANDGADALQIIKTQHPEWGIKGTHPNFFDKNATIL